MKALFVLIYFHGVNDTLPTLGIVIPRRGLKH